MEHDTMTGQRWVAFGPVGAVGSIHRTEDGFVVRMIGSIDSRGEFPTLDAAKGALHRAMPVGSDWPEFREH